MTTRVPVNSATTLPPDALFSVGEKYTRRQVAQLIGLPATHWEGGPFTTGYMRWQDAFYIFCNVDTAGRTGHDYPNGWEGNLLRWYGKTQSALHQPMIQAMLSGEYPVHVFWRRDPRSPFVYAGLATPHDAQDTRPVQITWAFETPQQQPNVNAPSEATVDPSIVLVRESPTPTFRRGPVPFIGQRTLETTDAETCVYVMRLSGPIAALFPSLPPRTAVIKVGRSNNAGRRCRELNNGFPKGCISSWEVVETKLYPTVIDADRAENQLHRLLENRGYWLSGEFFAIPEDLLPLLDC